MRTEDTLHINDKDHLNPNFNVIQKSNKIININNSQGCIQLFLNKMSGLSNSKDLADFKPALTVKIKRQSASRKHPEIVQGRRWSEAPQKDLYTF